jgi:hypothetical protein
MLALLIVLALLAGARGAWLLLCLWRLLPRRNADFNLL